MAFSIPVIADLDNPDLARRLQHALDNKTKPQGSLGRLEALAARLGSILGSTTPELRAPQMVVFAGDHGLAACHGRSAAGGHPRVGDGARAVDGEAVVPGNGHGCGAQGSCHQDFRRVRSPVRREQAGEVLRLHESLDRSRRGGDRPGKRGDRDAVSVKQHKTGYVAGCSQFDPQAPGFRHRLRRPARHDPSRDPRAPGSRHGNRLVPRLARDHDQFGG